MELPPEVLIEKISYLPFKQAARLSLVAKRWRNLYREMKNIVFKESDFAKDLFSYDTGTTHERVSFVHRMEQWISRFPGNSINRFEIYFPAPYGFQETIASLVDMVLSKQVKILVLDFSHPETSIHYHVADVVLPGCVYDQTTTIESLKLISCSLDSSKFKNSTVLRSLTIGRLDLKDVTIMLSNFPSLECLRFVNCLSLDYYVMFTLNQRLRELVFEDCDFSPSYCTLELPQVVIVKCSGNLPCFTFHGVVSERMQEAELDFWLEGASVYRTEVDLGKLLNGVSHAKTLTICSFALQVIPCDDGGLLSSFGTRHLVMRTNLHPYELTGISLMIHKCPLLESLTLQIVPPKLMEVLLPKEFNADTYWLDEITHECLEKTLKVVVVRGFGNLYELQILTYLVKHGLVLERLDLYMSEDEMLRVQMALLNVPRGSSRLQITLHNA
ncbi:unnamed protein product [Microthlaspi erraticum]|uniref:F-box domain-containing protein n=1 Tax=Microthlaspi erraticum TaxID=1685480 RepID=A0A6D2I7Q9_9BRAS|nr:unnamed protein product [Microthlaspi erraticum]CAA7025900.1 unnamed protein product [Microthlaspi erraticum]